MAALLERFRVPLSWSQLFKQTFNETLADDVFNLAAQQAYYFFFALFPALLALISIASFFPIENLTGEINTMLQRVAPEDVTDIVTEQIRKIGETNAGGILTLAFFFTLWSSSSAVVAMCNTLNAAYDITESRPWWKVRLTAIGLTIGLALFILVSMTLVVAGPALAEKIAEMMRLGPVFTWSWKILQWPLVFALVVTAVALVYYFAPDAEQDWVWITPGSVVATLLWVVASFAFRFYVTNFASYNETYGAIGGVMVLLLWFYVSGIALLIGARITVRQGCRREGTRREKENRAGGAACVRGTPRPRALRCATIPGRCQLRSGSAAAAARTIAAQRSPDWNCRPAAGSAEDRARRQETG
jgi:membrane protein